MLLATKAIFLSSSEDNIKPFLISHNRNLLFSNLVTSFIASITSLAPGISLNLITTMPSIKSILYLLLNFAPLSFYAAQQCKSVGRVTTSATFVLLAPNSAKPTSIACRIRIGNLYLASRSDESPPSSQAREGESAQSFLLLII